MSEEEKKAIEWLNKYIKNIKHEWQESEDSKAVRTVLNLITKLQKENEYWKNGFEKELEDNRKNTTELLKQDLIIRLKDKQIDLMAEKLTTPVNNKKWIKLYYQELAKEQNNVAK